MLSFRTNSGPETTSRDGRVASLDSSETAPGSNEVDIVRAEMEVYPVDTEIRLTVRVASLFSSGDDSKQAL